MPSAGFVSAEAAFSEVQKNPDGAIGFAAFITFVQRLDPSMSSTQITALFQAMDTEGKDSVSFQAFCDWWKIVEASGVEAALKFRRKKVTY